MCELTEIAFCLFYVYSAEEKQRFADFLDFQAASFPRFFAKTESTIIMCKEPLLAGS